jgi:ABC-type nitrate/sulfonate/bicarbonate transport system substrate-binding protein
MSLTRRNVLESATALGALAALQAAAGPALALSSPGEATSFRSSAKSWLWAVEDYARTSGLFEKAGLKLTSTATTRGVNTDALLSDAADILIGAPTQTMRVQVKRQPIFLVAGMVNKYASHVIVKREILEKRGVSESSPIPAKVAAMKGVKFGTTGPGAAPDSLLRFLAEKGGLDPEKDLELVTIKGAGQGMLAALRQGQIDGFCLSSPTSDVAVKSFGGAYLFNMATNPPKELEDYLYIGATVSQKLIKEQPQKIVAYCKGIAAALKAMNGDPAAFEAWAKQFFSDMPEGVFEPAFAANSKIYVKDPRITEAQFKLNVQFLDRESKVAGQEGVPDWFTFDKAVDNRFMDEALKSI